MVGVRTAGVRTGKEVLEQVLEQVLAQPSGARPPSGARRRAVAASPPDAAHHGWVAAGPEMSNPKWPFLSTFFAFWTNLVGRVGRVSESRYDERHMCGERVICTPPHR